MSARMHIFGDDGAVVDIECEPECGTIWIRAENNRVSLNLEPHQLDALEVAIAASRKALAVQS